MISQFEYDYKALLDDVLYNGEDKTSRAGDTRSIFGTMLKIKALKHGLFPILTARKMFPKPVWGELAAFVRGCKDVADFKRFGCNYWDANAAAWSGNDEVPITAHRVGKIYGAQWRDFDDVDQLQELLTGLVDNPTSRRHLLTAYNPAELHLGCLPPCHLLAQFNVTPEGFLDCCVTMRSVDLCLGLPSDIVLYATLMLLVANEVELKPGELTFMMGDSHIYANHLDVWKQQRQMPCYALPTWQINQDADVLHFVPEDITLNNYQSGEKLVYPFNV